MCLSCPKAQWEALKELVTAEEGKLLTWVGKAGGTEEYVVATDGDGNHCVDRGWVGREEPERSRRWARAMGMRWWLGMGKR